MKAKLKHYKNIKREIKSMILIWTTKMPKFMANTSFYRPKFESIDLMTNYWVGDHILTWWQSLSSCLNKTSFEFEPLMKVLGNCLSFLGKKIKVLWVSRTQDIGWTLNSLLLLQFGLENGLFKSWTPMNVLGLCLAFHPYNADLNPRSTTLDMTQLPNSVSVSTEPTSLL